MNLYYIQSDREDGSFVKLFTLRLVRNVLHF